VTHWWLSFIVSHKCTVVDNENICNAVTASDRDIKLQRTYMWISSITHFRQVDNENICNAVTASDRDIKLQRTYMWISSITHFRRKIGY